MFICQNCRTQQPPTARPVKVVLQTRPRTYFHYIKPSWNGGPPQKIEISEEEIQSVPEHLAIEETHGSEIVREIGCCDVCAKHLTAPTVPPVL